MPVRVLDPPPAGLESIRSLLSDLLAEPDLLHGPLAAAGVDRLVLTAPHPVFTVGLQDLADRGLDGVAPVGVRFLVLDGVQPVASVELDEDGSFKSVNEGPFVSATANAVLAAEALAEVQAGSFELRVLRIGALHTMAVWLKNDAGPGDIFIPMSPGPKVFPPGRPLDAAQFLGPLQALARKQLSATDPSAQS